MLEIKKARSIFDYFKIREIRNCNFQYLTGDIKKISILRQITFYLRKPNFTDLYLLNINMKTIGYILYNNKNSMITEVIDINHRGQGFASTGIEFIKQKYKRKIFAEIKKSNIASIKLHKKHGFVFNGANGENEIYCYDPKMIK